MNPYKLSQVYKQLTSQNSILKKYLKLGTKDIKQPDLPAFVEQKNMFNRFMRDNPRPDQLGRKDMAGGGMLVQPSADGSRPGYAKSKMGKSKLGEGMENIFKEKIGPGKFRYFIKVGKKKYGQVIGEENLPALKKKRDQVIKKLFPKRITDEDFVKLKNLKKYENMSSVEFSKVLNDKGFTTISGKDWTNQSTLRKIDELDLELVGRARSEDEIFEIVKKTEGGASKIKLYKEGIIPLEKLREIATNYEKRQSPEYKKGEGKRATKLNLKRAQELGNFPPGANPNDNLWAQVYRSAKDGDGRWKIVSKLPPLKDGKRDWIKNGDWKKMRVIDTQTGTEFGYNDLKNYLDNLEGPGTYDNALKPWKNKKDLNAVKIKYRGNTVSLGKVLSNKKIEKEFFEKTGKFPKGVEVEEINNFFKKRYPYGKSNFAVNHPEGVKNNWWKAEVVHKDANDRLERLDKSFRASLNSAQNDVQRNRIIELYKKDVKNIGNVTSVFEGQIIGKSNLFSATKDAFKKEGLTKTFSANEKEIRKALALIGCPNKVFKASGGRVGYQDGTDICPTRGAQIINSGMKNATPAQLKNFAAFANRAKNLGRNVMKFGIIPEAMYVAADATIRLTMGDKPVEALLRASEYLLPGDQTKLAEMMEATRLMNPETAAIIGRSIDYKNQLAKIQSLEDTRANLENLSGGGEFDYVGDLNQDVKNLDNQIKQATDNLNANFKMTDAELIYANRMQDEVDDIRKSKSLLTKIKSKFRDTGQDSDIETLGAPEVTQEQLNKRMANLLPRDLLLASEAEMIQAAKTAQAQGYDIPDDYYIQQQQDVKNMSLAELAAATSPEQIYGTSGTMGEPLNKGVVEKPQNIIGDMEREITGQTNVANPFDLDLSMIGSGLRGFSAAGGGIAKQAGVDSGPPPDSGPNPQGLSYLMKRGKNI